MLGGAQKLRDEPLSGAPGWASLATDLSALLSSWRAQPELFSGKARVGLGLWQGKAYLNRSVWLLDPHAASRLFCI